MPSLLAFSSIFLIAFVFSKPIPWLGSRMSGMVCIIAVSCISFVGFYLILLLSGCDKIPNTYQEAASIDGATDLVCFFKITLPLLRDVLVISISLWIINAIKYFELIWAMFRGVLKAVAISVILYVTNMVSTNFFGLYVTQRLGLSENFLALFPILNAAVMLIFMIGLQHRINATKFRIPLWIGLALYVVAALVLIFSPADRLGFVLLYVFIAAVAAALVNPRKDALLQLNITPQERARLNALIMASTVALSSPFGYLAGWLSSMDRRLPFVFTLLLFVTAMFVIGRIQEPQVEER